MLSLEQVSKRYGATQILAPTTLKVAAGGTHALIGPSGSGKTTLIKLMIGLVRPDTGRVCIDGETLTEQNADTLRHRLGYVIQEGGLFPHLTARENAGLLARRLGWRASRTEERIASLMALTQLPDTLLDRYPAQLSGGQRQRLALVRALMLDPPVLLLDEPLGALDPLIRHDLQEQLKSIFETLQKTVVIVTHDMGEAAFFAEHIVLLRDGRIVQQGSAQELVRRPAEPFVERFIQAQRSPLAMEHT